jgi:hypothetical protein
MDEETVIAELKRVAEQLQTKSLSRSTFQQYEDISSTVVERTFGSWNEAIEAAGLLPLPQGGLTKSESKRLSRLDDAGKRVFISPQSISDEDLLQDLVRLENEIGKRPSTNQVFAKGKYDPGIYRKRWDSIQAAYEIAYEKFDH